jgi:hypothetical protein
MNLADITAGEAVALIAIIAIFAFIGRLWYLESRG